jgi:hypothetical protein
VYKKAKFLFFCMIFVAGGLIAQNMPPFQGHLLPVKNPPNTIPQAILFKPVTSAVTFRQPFLSPAYYASQLGFFCKREIKFEKTAKIPLKFRLGSVAECDWMEGKYKRH